MSRIRLLFLVFSLILSTSPISAQTDALPLPGIIHEQISCRQNSSETYALYLPTTFSPDRTWPILVSLDPGGRVMIPMNLLKVSAETAGYILICPQRVKNGPLEPAVQALSTVWADVVSRLPIDGKRVYTVGFSGGARMASLFPLVTGQGLAGILACGAGLSQGVTLDQLANTLYLGIAGFADFNYAEMVRLDQAFSDRLHPAWFLYIDQPHQWPSAERLQRAITLFEVQAMKEGLLARDNLRINELFLREITAVSERSQLGEVYFAAREALSLYALFSGLLPPEELAPLLQKLKEWQEGKAFKRFQKDEMLRLQRETDTLGRVARAFSLIRQGPGPGQNLVRLIGGLDLHAWVKQAAQIENPYESGLARRILSAVADAARDEASTHLGQKQLERAELATRIRCDASQGTPWFSSALYDHACIYAQLGRKKEALKTLEEAIAKGFSDLKFLMDDPDFNSLRSSDAFQTILKKLQQ